MFSRLLQYHSAEVTRTWSIMFVMGVFEWVSSTNQLPWEYCYSHYEKQQYGFELTHNLQKYKFNLGRKNWLFCFAEGLTMHVWAKPMCQLSVGRKTKECGWAKIKFLCVCQYVFLVVKFNTVYFLGVFSQKSHHKLPGISNPTGAFTDQKRVKSK